MSRQDADLWRHPYFLTLWAGQTVSLFGSQATALALPIIAILALDAGPMQMAGLRAASQVPAVLVGLMAGVYVDRVRRRPVLIASDIGRAICLGLIPFTWAVGMLRLELLIGVAIAVSALSVLYDVAIQSFMPTLVGRAHLVEANSRLEISRSITRTAGPSLAGTAVGILTAPFAIIVDAASFLVSAATALFIRVAEPTHTGRAKRQGVWADLLEGIRAVMGDRLLRPMLVATLFLNLGNGIILTVLFLYFVRDLGLAAGAIGIAQSCTGVGLLGGSLIARRAASRIGHGRVILVAALLHSASWLVLVPATGSLPIMVFIVCVAMLAGGFGTTMYNISVVSVRQQITPDHLLGRVNATFRYGVVCLMPLGFILGGLLGELAGLRTALLIGACAGLAGLPRLLRSPVRDLRAISAPTADGVSTPVRAASV